MSLLFLLHVAVTWALVGLIWTIQLVQYPLFGRVKEDQFTGYHRGHMERITWVVAPLMLGECLSAGGLLLAGSRDPLFLASLLPLAVIWLSTWLVQVPLHRRLEKGFTAEAHQRLVRSNWVRTLGWTLRGICVLMLGR